MNNLQVALARIQTFGGRIRRALHSFFSRPCLVPKPKTEPHELVVKLPLSNSKVENHIMPEALKDPQDELTDFITNANVWVSVPIAEAESDLDDDDLEEDAEDAEGSKQEAIPSMQVRFAHWST